MNSSEMNKIDIFPLQNTNKVKVDLREKEVKYLGNRAPELNNFINL